MRKTIGVVLAAGLSRRFGTENKLLAPLRGKPLLTHVAEALLSSGCDQCIAVTSDPATEKVLPEGFTVTRITPGQEMAQSFRSAITIAREAGADRLLLCLGDMPGITGPLLRQLLSQPGSVACISGARRMPPVVLRDEDFEAAWQGAQGDAGARLFLQGLPASALLAIPPEMASDIDLPQDLASFGSRADPRG